MKLILFALPILILLFSTGCVDRNRSATVSDSPEGVIINGVRWATRNVAEPGIFAETIESVGGFFNWQEAQNVCPAGWRLPTQEEFELLQDVAGDEWTAIDGVNGRTFGRAGHAIFLPAAGNRGRFEGQIGMLGEVGYYWSNAMGEELYPWLFGFHRTNVGSGSGINFMVWGFSVRCVAEE